MSIRLRLTLLYMAVLAVTLLLFGTVAYLRLDSSLRGEVDRSLRERAARDFSPSAEARLPRAPSDNSPGRTTHSPASIVGFRLGDPEILVQLDDGQGQPLQRSANLNTENLPQPQHTSSDGFATETVNHIPFRVLKQPLSPGFGRLFPGSTGPYTVLLALPLGDTENALNNLRVILLLGGVGCLAFAGLMGWLMACGALRPIERLRLEAQRIGRRQDFSRRVDHHGPDDEVGRLATTFNEMLDGLMAAHQRVQRALDAQRRFVADASHELRTPLTTIRGNIDLLELESHDASPDRREALGDIASEAERMSRLVNNLLALARADGGQRIARRPVDLRPILEEVCQKAQRLANGVDLRLEDPVDAQVLGDRDYLIQLLFILLDNAIKATPVGGRITLASRWVGSWLHIAVVDTGIGIKPEDQARVFDRFYRADLSRHGEGTGLGLSIATWIAGELGGRIELKSAPGEGSTFTVILPALSASTTVAGSTAERGEVPSAAAAG